MKGRKGRNKNRLIPLSNLDDESNDVNTDVIDMDIVELKPLKNSRYQRTKQLFVRSIAFLITCNSMKNAEQILEAIFIVAMSKYDGQIVSNVDTLKQDTQFKNSNEKQTLEFDSLDSFDVLNSFKDWSKLLALKCKEKIGDVEGEFDNAQFVPEIVPIIINTMKLFPCWSNIMINVFRYGDNIASSSRIESNFNNIKNRVLKNDNLPMRVDDFVEWLVEFYRGDHLILQTKEDEKPTEVPLNKDCSEPICSPISSDGVCEKVNKNIVENILEQYIACKNGDFPTGLHRCSNCNKAVLLFRCSVEDPISEEGCGEKRICLACTKIDELETEKNQLKFGRKKRKYVVIKTTFNEVILALFRNGSCFQNKPICVPGYNKVLLNNTCSADSLLSILAVSVAESNNYKKYLTEGKNNNNVADFVKKMIGNRPSKEMYRDRVYLLVLHFITESKDLVGDIMLVNTVNTAASMCEKLLEDIPSYIRLDTCQNMLCFDKEKSSAGGVVITFIGVDGNIGFRASSKYSHLENTTKISQNYAGKVLLKLGRIRKTIIINGDVYNLRGVIAFDGSARELITG
ncbi:NOF-FB transposable element protein [Aphis craccivora]|uniref:NOF-FB transposable element protein n=1 Tax=Aphis craccivora TaxID=307492 RepID=A0A6G0XZH1_APHCR|nr:NOF-FB transposable element protein [Aphis craccivora]